MSVDSSAFSCLPLAVRDALLQQAFQQLDQRHLFGVAPRVCRLWHQLSLSIITSLDVSITTEEAAEQLGLWIETHGAVLESMKLSISQQTGPEAAHCILESLGMAAELGSLCISTTPSSELHHNPFHPPLLGTPLPHLPNLTSLKISNFRADTPVLDSILGLTNLSSLSMCSVQGVYSWEAFMKQLSTRLLHLTCLDFSGSLVRIADLAHLCHVPDLKQRKAGHVVPSAQGILQLGALPVSAIFLMCRSEEVGEVSSWMQTAAGGLQELALIGFGERFPASQLPLLQAMQLKAFTAARVTPNMAHVIALTQLTSVGLNDCGLHDAALCSLSTLSNLQQLSVSGNSGITGAEGSMQVLARSMPSLTLLVLDSASAREAARVAFEHRVVSLRGGRLELRPLPVAEL